MNFEANGTEAPDAEFVRLRGNEDDIRRRLLLEFLQKKYTRPPVDAHEESFSQRMDMQLRNQVALPDDLLFKILTLLPAETFVMIQFVCKKWFNLINSPVFIRCHTKQSETALICQKLTLLEPGNHPLQSEAKINSYFHFLDFNNGEDRFIESNLISSINIQASCDGLVLATVEKKKGLILMNPVTRKHTMLPSGKIENLLDDSYGIAFCNEAKTYKVVHLFHERERPTGCEILSICTKKWRRTEGPPQNSHERVRYASPVSIAGSLYWMSRCGDVFVLMDIEDEKFITKKCPTARGTRNKLIDIGGSLGYVTDHAEVDDTMQVWILVNDGETWMKHYNIGLNDNIGRLAFPICSTRNGRDIVLENFESDLYAYDSDKDEVKLIYSTRGAGEGWFERIGKLYILHCNTLATWEN